MKRMAVGSVENKETEKNGNWILLIAKREIETTLITINPNKTEACNVQT